VTKALVLIVEDNPINRELMDYVLRAHGFDTLNAMDGGIGLDMIRRERPDLVLCDIQMPVVDGFEFTRLVKADPQLKHIPVIAVTAFAMVGDRDRILASGFDGYIAKPIDPTQFVGAVNAFLPMTRRAADPPISPSQPVLAPPAKPTTVVALDDTSFNLELKRDLLRPHGYRVLTASTMAEAWHLVQTHRPDLIISDVGMAEGNGFDFIRCVKADPALRHIPFIFLSSTHWDEASQHLGLALGALRYLRRPMEPAELLAQIQACLS